VVALLPESPFDGRDVTARIWDVGLGGFSESSDLEALLTSTLETSCRVLFDSGFLSGVGFFALSVSSLLSFRGCNTALLDGGCASHTRMEPIESLHSAACFEYVARDMAPQMGINPNMCANNESRKAQ
jgi:hypothetical protein